VEKIRESLKNLKIEEKQFKPTRSKVVRGGPSSRSWFHDYDLDIPIGGKELSVQLHNLQIPVEGLLKKHSYLKHTGEKSIVNSDSLSCSRSERGKVKCDSSPGISGRNKSRDQLQKCYSDWNQGDSQTSKSHSSVSETGGIAEDTCKRKCDIDLQTNVDIDKDQSSPSPPNSPLYDMPPPSTLAQKQERRAKRLLQLERWKKIETSRSRQERYNRRAQGSAETMQKSVSAESRCVQWSQDLVQTIYIDDCDDEPNFMDSPMV